MKKGISILLFSTLLLGGCASSSTNNEVEVKKEKAITAREYIENNIFIDMDFEEMGAATRSASESAFDEAKFNAALYRFYKHVERMDNGIDVCNLKNGAEINMSEDLFLAVRNDMESFNDSKRKQIKDGIKAINPPFDDEYFKNLLK